MSFIERGHFPAPCPKKLDDLQNEMLIADGFPEGTGDISMSEVITEAARCDDDCPGPQQIIINIGSRALRIHTRQVCTKAE